MKRERLVVAWPLLAVAAGFTFAASASNGGIVSNFLAKSAAERIAIFADPAQKAKFRNVKPRPEDAPPRFMAVDGVNNMRDIGGWVGLGGRRLRHGLAYRSAAFDSGVTFRKNDKFEYLFGLDPVTDAEKNDFKPAKRKITEKGIAELVEGLGIRSDLDLRSPHECFGKSGSPLGPRVKWFHCPQLTYGEFGRADAKRAFAAAFRVFLDRSNYPIVFHCAGGADRTGAIAFMVNGVCGVALDDLRKDWELTAFGTGHAVNPDFTHARRFDRLVAVVEAQPGTNLTEKIVSFVKSCGFTDADIARVREIFLPGMAPLPVSYDESKIPPYTLEDPLAFADGTKLKDASEWPKRRAEILGIFAREMYGAEPPKPEAVVTETIESGTTLATLAVREQVRMWFRKDRTGPYIDWLIVRPRHATGPVPVVMHLNYYGNHEFLTDSEVRLPHGWMQNEKDKGITAHRSVESLRGRLRRTDCRTPFPVDMILSRGYAFMTACYADISPDPDWIVDDLEKLPYTGVFELWGPRDESRTDNPTALGAWAWALSRGLDYIETDAALNAKRVVVTGCSRLGKAALLAAARDERFAVCVPNQTGKGGVPLNKHFYGENVSTETMMFPHWFCKAYRKYIDNERAMPFDQHLLLAAIAPRPLLVQGFNRTWFDPRGEYLAVKAAAPAWEFLGKPGIPRGGEPMDFSRAAVGPCLGYVRRPGQHGISGWDWKWLLDFADRALADRSLPVKLVPAPQRIVRKEGMFRSASANPPIAESRDASLPPEGYRLSVTPDGIAVASADDAGAFYARQTLFQLAVHGGGSVVYPCVEIEDFPAFRWRGLLLDESRHFFGMASVKRFLALMAQHKLNVFHWHLTDNEGWRIQIDRYPELTSVAAARPYSTSHRDLLDSVPEGAPGTYGPFFYTKDQIREIVAFAAARHIRVVPEIEIPGHSRAALRAFPDLLCFADATLNSQPSTLNPAVQKPTNAVDNVYCAGSDAALDFLENVLDEVCALFPDPVVHIGGDEVEKVNWKACPKCRARMAAVGAKTPEELQAWMNGHFAASLAKRGKKPIWWGEIPEGKIPADLAVMSWLGPECGVAAAKKGHEVVMCPHKSLYFDYTPCLSGDPRAYPYFTEKLPVETVYAYDPLAGIPAAFHRYVLGGEGCNWTEYTCSQGDLDWKCWTRAAAMAEVLWTAPKSRDPKAFLPRLRVHLARLKELGVEVAPVSD